MVCNKCHSIAIQRSPVLSPEISLPHRPPTGIITFSYKLTGLPVYGMTFKHNHNEMRLVLRKEVVDTTKKMIDMCREGEEKPQEQMSR